MESYTPEAVASAPTRLGRYELLGQLATGGMAEIHLARLAGAEGFEKIVVVKRLLPELVASKAYVAMLLDEGKLAGRLDHPNVCEVFELGKDGGEYFLVMPYLDGVPATDFIARPRDPDRLAQLRIACGIVTQACAGLHHAHELRAPDGAPLGLVHRDVSPSNLFVMTNGLVKVLDFGIAKVIGGAETEAGTIKGKTQYMAPEQLLGEPLDRRCDTFALGIVLYELATHQRLFKRASDYLSARAILEDPIPRADSVDPAVPAALADVIAKALARDRDQRYATAKDLARAIEGALGGVATQDDIAAALAEWHGAELSALRTRQAKVLGSHVQTVPLAGVGPVAGARAARGRRWWPLAVVGVLVLAAGGGWLGLHARSSDAPPQAAPRQAATQETAGQPPASQPPANQPAANQPPANQPAANQPAANPPAVPHRPAHPSPAHKEPGLFSIDSTPYATIYVDGRKLGFTPISKQALAAGHHRIRAVLPDGRTKEQTVDIVAGKQAPPILLSW
ncbi:MAG TPA: protein kinase [Kofleriaceae bacterium]|nr:protein kinase [Kofleriaceae bacterium]